MTWRFPYEWVEADPSYADPNPFIYRPVLPIVIHGLTRSYPTRGILDTGAAETILPTSLVDGNVIDPAFRTGEDGILTGSDGRSYRVTYGTVDLAVRLKRKVHRWHAKVAFSPYRKDILLGDAGFLRYFTVTFNRRDLYTTLRPNGPFPPALMPAR